MGTPSLPNQRAWSGKCLECRRASLPLDMNQGDLRIAQTKVLPLPWNLWNSMELMKFQIYIQFKIEISLTFQVHIQFYKIEI